MKNFIRQTGGRLLAAMLRLRSRPYPFSGGPVLVVAPHADDETLGCGGLLAAKTARGQDVHVVFITDSAGSPEDNPPPGQAAQRRAEALAALAVLGVDGTRAHFLAAPDGRLNRLSPAEAAALDSALVQLLQEIQPAEIFVPYLGGGSTEHDATTAAARAALTRSGVAARVWEYPVWAWWDFRRLAGQLLRPRENFRLVLGSDRARKQAALACHASQVGAAGGRGPALPAVLAALCTGPVEFYFHRQS